MSKRGLFAIASAVALFASIASAGAQAPRGRDDWRPDNRTDWESLGAAEIGTRLERDVIEVGRREGRFRSLGFTVTGSDVRIEDLRIIYVGGEVDELRVRDFFKAGTRSRPIDLPGRGQFIQRIEVTYRAPGPVRIEFFGEKRREAQWQQLGCQRVAFLEDNDVIRVGRREGAFRALKLTVADAKLRLDRMRVVFGNGESQTFDVRSVIPEGAETRPLDLDGRRRTIDRIELKYVPSLSLKSLKKGAQVCVLALEGDGGPDWRGGPGRDGPGRDGPPGRR
jgi:hypothetical protein